MQVALKLTPAEMLRSLYRLRWCAVAAALAIIMGAHLILGVAFAYWQLLTLTLALGAWNLLVGWRLHHDWAATELEGFAHLALDTLALTMLLYWGGGSTSPFVSLYLIPIAIAAAALPTLYAWSVTALAAGAYSMLLFLFMPLSRTDHGGFVMHVVGMWVTFNIGGLLLMIFVAGMAATVRRNDLALTHAREKMLRNEQVTALGALAAGAAHELATPLSTMAMIVAELREAGHDKHRTHDDLNVLEQQIELCKNQISHLLGAAEQARGQTPAPTDIRHWLESVIDRWRLMRPEVHATLNWHRSIPDTELVFDGGLSQALINLLNNAADASLENDVAHIHIDVACDAGSLRITIDDQGKGISRDDTERAGRLRFTTKADGRGLGLVLSHVSLEHVGGEVSLKRRTNGGTRTLVTMPLAQLTSA